MKFVTAEWLRKAERDYRSAEWEMQNPLDPNYDDVCFHCQQCIEKLMKAVLSEGGTHFPKTHNLEDLAMLIPIANPTWTCDPDDLKMLTPGAVQFRYPGWDASLQEALDALAACGRLRGLLRNMLGV